MDDTSKKVYTERKDLPLSTIREMVDDGEIIPDPDYQRDYVYTDKQASKLIESILIGIPIPVVYLCEQEDGTLNVIDGQQRIVSFTRYLKNEFALTGLSEYPELNKKKFKDLEKPYKTRIKTATLASVVIKESSKELQYEIFARLNLGSVKLYPQELRNCVYRGPFNSMLEEVAERNSVIPVLFIAPNKRKSYQELILRFFALRNFLSYQGSQKKALNDFMETHQNDSYEDIEKMRSLFEGTMELVKTILGSQAFCVAERDTGTILNKFSGSVYDSIAVPFSFFSGHDLMQHADEIRERINLLRSTDDEYLDLTYAASGNRKRVVGRIMKVYTILIDVTGGYGNDDTARLFSSNVKTRLWSKGYICSYCGNEILSPEDAEIDHAIPYSMGGRTVLENAQLLHRQCNRAKGNSLERTDPTQGRNESALSDEDWELRNKEQVMAFAGASLSEPPKSANKTFLEEYSSLPGELRQIADELIEYCKNLGSDVIKKQNQQDLSFRRKKNFASMVVNASKVKVYLSLEPWEVELSENVLDASQKGHWGSGDVELILTKTYDLVLAKDLIAQSYEKNND